MGHTDWKQVIVVRKDLEMSPAKMSVQVSHASLAYFTWLIRNHSYDKSKKILPCYSRQIKDGEVIWDETRPQPYMNNDLNKLAEAAREEGRRWFEISTGEEGYHVEYEVDGDMYENWINGRFTKIVLAVKGLTQLENLAEKAKEMGFKEKEDYFIIRDACWTELTPENLDGTTTTCIGFRPMKNEEIDPLTKRLRMYH